ncbi:MAG: hypothetical protein MJZ11_01335 [Lachnospiraceae bacterium]|nr:hypothetical protein [Lachnospiraceae bacterium]
MLDELKHVSTKYEPYKHVMQDTGSLYIGAKSTYLELTKNEDVSFKMKAIIKQYILKEADPENTLESEFYYMTDEGFIYEVYSQLKVKVKTQILVEKKRLFRGTESLYVEKVYSLKDLVNINLAKKKGMGMVITEIIVSKFALMSFTV